MEEVGEGGRSAESERIMTLALRVQTRTHTDRHTPNNVAWLACFVAAVGGLQSNETQVTNSTLSQLHPRVYYSFIHVLK